MSDCAHCQTGSSCLQCVKCRRCQSAAHSALLTMWQDHTCAMDLCVIHKAYQNERVYKKEYATCRMCHYLMREFCDGTQFDRDDQGKLCMASAKKL